MLNSIRSRMTPALLTTTSSRPRSPAVAVSSASAVDRSPTSPATTVAWPPPDRISSAASSAAPGRSLSTTCAPARARASASAFPRPAPAPVTIATRPSRDSGSELCMVVLSPRCSGRPWGRRRRPAGSGSRSPAVTSSSRMVRKSSSSSSNVSGAMPTHRAFASHRSKSAFTRMRSLLRSPVVILRWSHVAVLAGSTSTANRFRTCRSTMSRPRSPRSAPFTIREATFVPITRISSSSVTSLACPEIDTPRSSK